MRAQIVDAAELLAELELAAGDPSASARAARTGLSGDVRRRAAVAGADAGRARGRATWPGSGRRGAKCLDAMTEIAADGEPHPDTAALYQELIGEGRPQPAAWTRSYR